MKKWNCFIERNGLRCRQCRALLPDDEEYVRGHMEQHLKATGREVELEQANKNRWTKPSRRERSGWLPDLEWHDRNDI